MERDKDGGTTLNPEKVLVALMNDLFFGVKIQEAAKAQGAKVLFVKDIEQLEANLAQAPAAILFDLNYTALDPVAAIRNLKSREELRQIPAIGFVSHVQVHLKQAAEEAGCNVVVARSVFSRDLPVILRQYL